MWICRYQAFWKVKLFLQRVEKKFQKFEKSYNFVQQNKGNIMPRKDIYHDIYLAIPTFAWKSLENKELVQELVTDSNIRLILFDPIEKVIKSWKD